MSPLPLDMIVRGRSCSVRQSWQQWSTISTKSYQSFDHGYATTIHKTQGATVDRAYVMASQTMDRHLTYVAMTRHRDGAQLYASQDEFTDRKAGRLVEHGKAPYENDPKNRDSYCVTLENDKGQKHTTWGVDLERAMKDARTKAISISGTPVLLMAKGSTDDVLTGSAANLRASCVRPP